MEKTRGQTVPRSGSFEEIQKGSFLAICISLNASTKLDRKVVTHGFEWTVSLTRDCNEITMINVNDYTPVDLASPDSAITLTPFSIMFSYTHRVLNA